jgi:hypothetical protein
MSTKPPVEEAVPPPETPSPDVHPPTHFEREDDRWSPKAQLRDWWILLLMILTYLAWTGIIYFFEPGIR